MQPVVFGRICICIILLLFSFSCKKKENISKKIVGIWKSVTITTDIYEQDKIKETFTLTSDEKSFSIMEFYSDSSFKSSGQFALNDNFSDSTIKLDDQVGKYQIKGDKLIMLNNTASNLTMIFNLDENDFLTIVSEQMNLPNLNGWNTDQKFVTSTTFRRTRL